MKMKTNGGYRELDAWGRVQEAFFKPEYFDGSNEVVMIFNQKSDINFDRESVYAFRQCGH